MASIKESLQEQIKTAMKAGDKEKLLYARSLHSAIRKKEIDDRVDLDDAAVTKIITSVLKQRQDSIEQFKQGGRLDLVAKEEAEAAFLKTFLPEQMSEAELTQIVEQAIAEAKATTAKDMGAVMKLVMPKTAGRADGKVINQLIRAKLGG